MAQAHLTVVGAPPSATQLAWLAWYSKLLRHRRTEVPLTRTTTYYVAANGSDSNDGLSTAAPFLTLSKVQTVLTASSGDVRFRFRRGDTWKESTGITCSKNNVTFDDWFDSTTGYKAAPKFSRFTLEYNSTGWSAASGNRYTRTEASTIAWIRYQTNPFGTIFIRASSSAECESTSNSFYWASSVLHINLGGTNPNTVNLEAVADNTGAGILINNVDGIRVRNISIHGFGCSATAGSYGLKVQNSSLKIAVVEHCEVFYSGDHCMGHNEGASSTAGGICVFYNCRAGLGYNGGSGVGWVTHNGNGDQETIWHGCEAAYGALPQTSWYNATTRPRTGTAIYGHTGGTPYKIGLAIVYGLEIYNNSYGCEVGARFNNSDSVSATGIEDARVFVNETMLGNQPCGILNMGLQNHVFINCNYHVQVMSGISNQIPQDATCSGWLLNTSLTIERANVVWNSGANGPHSFKWWHGLVRVIQPVTGVSTMMAISAAQAAGTASAPSFVNTILAMDPISGITTRVNTRNHLDNLKGNAYAGVLGYSTSGSDQGYDADTSAVQLGAAPSMGIHPEQSSPLYRVGVALPGGYKLEYDQDWDARNLTAPSIGPQTELNAYLRPRDLPVL